MIPKTNIPNHPAAHILFVLFSWTQRKQHRSSPRARGEEEEEQRSGDIIGIIIFVDVGLRRGSTTAMAPQKYYETFRDDDVNDDDMNDVVICFLAERIYVSGLPA
jgi:hypothetical protein